MPQYTNEDFVVVEPWGLEAYAIPAMYFSEDQLDIDDEYKVVAGMWWCRLSDAGYRWAPDWMGPFGTLDEAKAELRDVYEVDPDTGDSLGNTMNRYAVEQTATGVLLGVYEGETPEEAIRAMLADAGDDGEPDPGLVAHEIDYQVIDGMWWCRLRYRAPDWMGPFGTLDEAKAELRDVAHEID